MTKHLIPLLVLFSISTSLCSSQNNIAVVNKIKGFYIFIDSEPLAEYDAIGEIKSDGNDPDIQKSGAQYSAVRDNLINTARQVNYTADGLILSLVNGGTDKATIIKFKEGQQNISHARVQQYQGLYIFVDSQPLQETEYLGTVKVKRNRAGSQYTAIRDRLIKDAKRKMKSATGVIIKLVTGSADMADAIKFK